MHRNFCYSSGSASANFICAALDVVLPPFDFGGVGKGRGGIGENMPNNAVRVGMGVVQCETGADGITANKPTFCAHCGADKFELIGIACGSIEIEICGRGGLAMTPKVDSDGLAHLA